MGPQIQEKVESEFDNNFEIDAELTEASCYQEQGGMFKCIKDDCGQHCFGKHHSIDFTKINTCPFVIVNLMGVQKFRIWVELYKDGKFAYRSFLHLELKQLSAKGKPNISFTQKAVDGTRIRPQIELSEEKVKISWFMDDKCLGSFAFDDISVNEIEFRFQLFKAGQTLKIQDDIPLENLRIEEEQKVSEVQQKISQVEEMLSENKEKISELEEMAPEVEELSQDNVNIIEKSFALKEEGNNQFKQHNLEEAISLYSKVEKLLMPISPAPGDVDSADPRLAMVQGKTSVPKKNVKELLDLQATCFSNMAECHKIRKEFKECIDKAQRSLQFNKTIKAYYRMGSAYKALKNYDFAIEAFKNAIKLDTADPFDVQSDINTCQTLNKRKEKDRLEKLSKAMQSIGSILEKKVEPSSEQQ